MSSFAYSFQQARNVLARHTENVVAVSKMLDLVFGPLRSGAIADAISKLDAHVSFIERQVLPALERAEQLEAERDAALAHKAILRTALEAIRDADDEHALDMKPRLALRERARIDAALRATRERDAIAETGGSNA